jgi:hypothetical protein
MRAPTPHKALQPCLLRMPCVDASGMHTTWLSLRSSVCMHLAVCIPVCAHPVGLLEGEPRLLGLLTSKSALSPLVACITPAAAAAPPLYEQAAAAAVRTSGTTGDSGPGDAPSVGPDAHTDSTSSSGPAAAAAAAADGCLTGQALADTAEQLAYLGLQLLLRATANAAVQESLTDEVLLRQLYWLAVQPPSGRVLNAGLALLRRLSSSPLAASVGGYQGGAVMLLSVLLHTGRWVC